MSQETIKQVVSEVEDLSCRLTPEEDDFALAVVEYGGNVKAAYVATFGEDKYASAKAKNFLNRPHVAARVAELNGTLRESALISLESHLVELANIRDLAKAVGSLKVALAAEKSRGEVAGYYVTRVEAPIDVGSGVDKLSRLADRLVSLQRGISNQGAVDAQIVQIPRQIAA